MLYLTLLNYLQSTVCYNEQPHVYVFAGEPMAVAPYTPNMEYVLRTDGCGTASMESAGGQPMIWCGDQMTWQSGNQTWGTGETGGYTPCYNVPDVNPCVYAQGETAVAQHRADTGKSSECRTEKGGAAGKSGTKTKTRCDSTYGNRRNTSRTKSSSTSGIISFYGLIAVGTAVWYCLKK